MEKVLSLDNVFVFTLIFSALVGPLPVARDRLGAWVRPAGARASDARLNGDRGGKAEEYRKFRAKHKAEIVLAGLRGEVSIKEVCREHEIAETLYYSWREKLLEGGQTARWQGRTQQREGATAQDRQLERALGRKTYELEILGNGFRTWE